MKEKELRYMLAISEKGSIQKAALLLDKNPSSLGRAVRRIEAELDITLFKRTPAGLTPTREGEAYLSAAKDILELYDSLKS